MRKFLFAVLMCLFSTGCASSDKAEVLTLKLPQEYRPLEEIRERSVMLGLVTDSATAVSTVGRTAYVKDLIRFVERMPPGGPSFRARLRHEQIHSQRQLDHGVSVWIGKYISSTDFALAEEKIGWYWEIVTLREQGINVDVDRMAQTLSYYKVPAGKLISFEEARAWVQSVVDGKWRP